jgi:demethylmenaquinone methyltransferase/2-methoxy-6-polyprenyl-1,4-benzoquinol methylase
MLSFGIDISWRKKTINQLKDIQPKIILDIATGTGDLAIEALKLNPDKIIGIDISEGMLNIAEKKIKEKNLDNKIKVQLADSEKIPFHDNSFDACTVAFGVRNFENLEIGLSEIYRVTNKNGKVVILEFSKPKKFPIKQLYNFYFKFICPIIGKTISKDSSAYTYLYNSVNAFPEGKDFIDILTKCNFLNSKAIPLMFGIATIYVGEK